MMGYYWVLKYNYIFFTYSVMEMALETRALIPGIIPGTLYNNRENDPAGKALIENDPTCRRCGGKNIFF